MNLDFLNKRFNELTQARTSIENQLIAINGHISEVRNLLHEMAKAATVSNKDNEDGQVNE